MCLSPLDHLPAAAGSRRFFPSVRIRPAEASVRVPAQEYIREGTAEWRAWQRHLQATTGRGSPVDKRGGWHFPSRLPPLP
jgi:hypothetical protein